MKGKANVPELVVHPRRTLNIQIFQSQRENWKREVEYECAPNRDIFKEEQKTRENTHGVKTPSDMTIVLAEVSLKHSTRVNLPEGLVLTRLTRQVHQLF